jgi:tetratricopeptide (TPR) repeat protein
MRYFEQAVAADPVYALPYSGLADSYHLLSLYGIMRARDAYPEARAAALRALQVDERLAEGYLSLGCVALAYDWDWGQAEREFTHAIQLNPTYALAYHWYAWLLTAVNRRDEAVALIRRAVELEPLSLIILGRAGHILCLAGETHEALRYCERALELDSDFSVTYEVLALIHSWAGRLEEAVAALECLGTNTGSRGPILLPYVYAMTGHYTEAKTLLDRLDFDPKTDRVPTGYAPLWVCATHALLGETEVAFRWLEFMYEERSFSMILCHPERGYDSLRTDPRFSSLLKRIGLPTKA